MSHQQNLPPISVIVAEDEKDLLEEVVDFLAARGMDARGAATGPEFRRLYRERRPKAVVLDLNLAGEDGIAIAEKIRADAPTIGIVMTTARGSVRDRIAGYETGADVYLVKPVDLGELVAAIRATQRHRKAEEETEDLFPDSESTEWILDLVAWQLVPPGETSVQLTRAETQLLDCLTETPGVPVSRVEIGRRMGKSNDLQDHRYVDQVISRLRRKIEAKTGKDAPIGSAHNQGYYFRHSSRRI